MTRELLLTLSLTLIVAPVAGCGGDNCANIGGTFCDAACPKPDAGPDSAPPDLRPPDMLMPDTGADQALPDSAMPDSAVPDSAVPDSAVPDLTPPDAPLPPDAYACQAGLTLCAAQKKCRDLQNDRFNCGTCGKVCPAGQVCSMGQCAISCRAGLAVCSGKCIDLQSDNNNCGSCGAACAAGHMCSSGKCALSCQKGLTDCSGTCTNLQSDNMHCGNCLAACAPGYACVAGKCALWCQAGLTGCQGKCVDTALDPTNCGKCGQKCAAGSTCVAGKCSSLCGNGTVEAGEACDGAQLGGKTCKTLGYSGGTLKCAASCKHDTAGCTWTSCKEAQAKLPNAKSGVYTLDTDGPGPLAPFSVYCDMTNKYELRLSAYFQNLANTRLYCTQRGMNLATPKSAAALTTLRNTMITAYNNQDRFVRLDLAVKIHAHCNSTMSARSNAGAHRTVSGYVMAGAKSQCSATYHGYIDGCQLRVNLGASPNRTWYSAVGSGNHGGNNQTSWTKACKTANSSACTSWYAAPKGPHPVCEW